MDLSLPTNSLNKEHSHNRMSPIKRGLFQIEDLIDYDCETIPNRKQENKIFTEDKAQNKKEEENYSSYKSSKKRKNHRIKLEPLKKSAPQTIMEVGIEQRREDNQKEKSQEIKIMNRSANAFIIYFSDTDKEESEKEKEIENQNENKENKDSQEQQAEKEKDEQKKQDLDESDLLSPFQKAYFPIAKQKTSAFLLRRDREWFNKLRPQFNLYHQKNNEYAMSAKQMSNNTTTTFLTSLCKNHFQENGAGYLGKVKINFIGNIVNIYGPGFNPADAKKKKIAPRELLATVQYETNFFGSTRPRDFKVYTLKPGQNYYELSGTGEEQLSLNELFLNPANKEKITCLSTRKAQWNENMGGYILNFRGRVKKTSKKNFILEDSTIEGQEEDKEVMVFGKLDDDNFRMDIKYPLNNCLGLGIALSSFNSKIGCE